MCSKSTFVLVLLAASFPVHLSGGTENALPDPMVLANGARVVTEADWQRRRNEMKKSLLHWQYGEVPPVPTVRVENMRIEKKSVEGLDATPTLITGELVFGPNDALRMSVGCWVPGDAKGPAPAILGIEPVWWPDPFLRHGIVARLLSRGYAFVGFDHNALGSYEDQPSTRLKTHIRMRVGER